MVDWIEKLPPEAMDELNRGIISILSQDGRTSNKDIANRLSVNEATVASRIRTLFSDNIIRVVAQRSVLASGRNGMSALVDIHLEKQDAIEEVSAALISFDHVINAYETSERPELIANVRADDPRELNDAINAIGAALPHVAQMAVRPILSLGRYSSSLNTLALPTVPKPAPRDLDEAIVALLEEDGRQTARTLARTLGLSETSLRYRLNKILARPGFKIGLVCDAEALGFVCAYDFRISVAPSSLTEAMSCISQYVEARVVSHLSGIFNIHVVLLERSIDYVNAFTREAVRKLPGIKDYYASRIMRPIKYDINIDI